MQSRSIELAEKILETLKGEEFWDAVHAIKIAQILLPTKPCPIPDETRLAHEVSLVVGQ